MQSFIQSLVLLMLWVHNDAYGQQPEGTQESGADFSEIKPISSSRMWTSSSDNNANVPLARGGRFIRAPPVRTGPLRIWQDAAGTLHMRQDCTQESQHCDPPEVPSSSSIPEPARGLGQDDMDYTEFQYTLSTPNATITHESNQMESIVSVPPHARQLVTEHACELQINEVNVGANGLHQFIELARVCGSRARKPSSTKINGYILLVIEWTPTPRIILTANLNNQNLVKTAEALGNNEYFVFGSPSTVNVDMKFGNVESPLSIQYTKYPQTLDILPDELVGTTSVVLLYFSKANRKLIQEFNLPFTKVYNMEYRFTSLRLTSNHMHIIKCHVVDSIVYGTESDSIPSFLSNSLGLMAPALYSGVGVLTGRDFVSYSRCDNLFLNHDSFKYLHPTPGTNNNCPKEEDKLPFPSFKGIPIPVIAQKMVINVHSILKGKSRESALTGPPLEVASKILGLSMTKIKGILTDFRENSLHTKTKKQPNRVTPVQNKIDGFDREIIRTLISEGYKNGSAPYFREIYHNYMSYKKKGCISYTTSSEQLSVRRFLPLCTPDSIVSMVLEESNSSREVCENSDSEPIRQTHYVELSPDFSCHMNTFRKVLKRMGFVYKKIDDRVMLLQRPDIVAWRLQYIRKLDENSKLEKPLKILYTDETWLEENARRRKGWRLNRPANWKESKMFSYSTNKIGHGHRSVVIAAVTEDGIVKDSILVYEIKKENAAADYHSNVDSAVYMRWFKKLIESFDQTGDKFLIIMDNASYHASSNAPKSNARKQELYDWLKDMSEKPSSNVNLPDFKKITVVELWLLIRKLKDRDDMKKYIFEVDRYAKEHGHEVGRLPPYNCHLNPIEMLWSVVKRRVASRNARQNIKDVLQIAQETLETMDPNIIKNQFSHCMRLLEKHKIEDGYIEEERIQVPFYINSGDNEDDSSDESVCSGDIESENNFEPLVGDPEELDEMLGHQEHEDWQAGQSPPPQPPPKRPRWCFRDLKHAMNFQNDA